MPITLSNITHGNARSANSATMQRSGMRGGELRIAQEEAARRPSCERSELNKAFTLLEMSIVVAIIGLLMGGVLVGKNMYRTSKLQQVGVQMFQLGNAVRSFRDNYNALPGDMTAATTYWGLAGGTTAANDATCSAIDKTTLADARKTCNGNGDNFIGYGATTYAEFFHAYQHLQNAGLLGTLGHMYSGTTGPGSTNHYVAGFNAPVGPLPSTSYQIAATPSNTGSANLFALLTAGNIQFGTTNSTGSPSGATLSPKEIFNMDMKLDDGLPARGDIIAMKYQSCTNSGSFPSPAVYNTPDAYDIQYLQTDSGPACFVMLRNQF